MIESNQDNQQAARDKILAIKTEAAKEAGIDMEKVKELHKKRSEKKPLNFAETMARAAVIGAVKLALRKTIPTNPSGQSDPEKKEG